MILKKYNMIISFKDKKHELVLNTNFQGKFLKLTKNNQKIEIQLFNLFFI